METTARRLLLLSLLSALLGLALIYSATRYDPELHGCVWKQGAALLLGLVLWLPLSALDIRALLRRFWWLPAAGNVGLLLLLVPFGQSHPGEKPHNCEGEAGRLEEWAPSPHLLGARRCAYRPAGNSHE